MTIEIKKNEEATIISVVGRVDTITAPELEKSISEVIGETKKLVLDVKGMEYISSAGLRVLLATQKKLNKPGALLVTNVCDEIMEIFEVTGFTDILEIE